MRYFILAFLAVWAASLPAQQFIQEFRTPRNDAAVGVRQVENREYIMLSQRFGLSGPDSSGINLTKMSRNGRQRWSRDYNFDFPVLAGDLVHWPTQGVYLVSALSAVDTVRDKIVASFNTGGGLEWARRLGASNAIQPENNGRTKVLPVSDTSLVVAAGAGQLVSDTSQNDLMLAELDQDGQLLWSRNYCFSCLGNYDATLGDLLNTSDGGFLISGSLAYTDSLGAHTEALLLKTDTAGQLLWLKTYAVDSVAAPAPRLSAWNLAEPKTGQYVCTGSYDDLNSQTRSGLFLVLNDTGALQFSNRWSLLGGDFDLSTFDLLARDSGSVVMAGSAVEKAMPDTALEYNFLAAVTTDSLHALWVKNYFTEIDSGFQTPYHALIGTVDGGYAYYITTDTQFINANPVLVKTNGKGETGCEDDLLIGADTMYLHANNWVIATVDQTDIDTILLKDEMAYQGINPTMEGLELTGGMTGCEPLMAVLDATVKEAEQYKWSTGATTPTITATKAGQYTVQVTSNALCFNLPDTTTLNSIPPPMGAATANPDSLCAENKVLLLAGGVAVYSYLWSTGETTPEITVSKTGTYTVTLSNPCGSTTASVDVPRVGCVCNMIFPNAFTPDNDGNNDRFQPVFPCTQIQNFQLLVFNRWGENVYETRTQTDGWNGENNGQPAPSDVYAWVASYTTPEGQIVKMKGDVTLLR